MISRRRYYMPIKIVRREVVSDRDYSPKLGSYQENFESYFMRRNMERKDSDLSALGVLFINLFNLNYKLERK